MKKSVCLGIYPGCFKMLNLWCRHFASDNNIKTSNSYSYCEVFILLFWRKIASQKLVFWSILGICFSILLTACGSGDKSSKSKQDFQSNSKIQVIPAAQMTFVQQQQDFPESKTSPAYNQYAAAANTTKIAPVDLTDEDSGTSLPAMTEPTMPIQPVSIPASPPASPVNAATPNAATPSFPAPVTSGNTTSSLTESQETNTPSASSSQSSNQLAAPVPTSNNSSNYSTANDNPVGWSSQGNTNSTVTVAPTPASSSLKQEVTHQTTPMNTANTVIERYETLEPAAVVPKTTTVQPSPSSANSYENFDNLAMPVTFSNSPYNTQLNSFKNDSTQEASSPTEQTEQVEQVEQPVSASSNETTQTTVVTPVRPPAPRAAPGYSN